ncbi:MAG TPA: hypothetical protein VGK17_10325 [Propionicimonas sp.]
MRAIAPTALMAALALVHFKLRTIRKWAERTGFDNGDILLGLKPRNTAGTPGVDETPNGAIDPPVAA